MIRRKIGDMEPKDRLNPDLWGEDGGMKPELRLHLAKVANEAISYAKLSELGIKPISITVTGSMANYNYTEDSDLDLHILVDIPEKSKELAAAYLKKAKDAFNKTYAPEFMGRELEIYYQDVEEPHKSGGVYSVSDDKWIEKPKKYSGDIDWETAEKIALMIAKASIGAETPERAQQVKDVIKMARSEGLSTPEREFSAGNIAFKALRSAGIIDRLQGKIDMGKKKDMDYGV